MLKSRLFAIALIAFPMAAHAERFELHWAPEENLEQIDENLLKSASSRINLAGFGITSVPLLEILMERAERIPVRVYLDNQEHELMVKMTSKPSVAGQVIKRFLESKVQIKVKKSTVFMHLKAYTVDQTLRFGSANFSPSGLKRQDNDLMITDNPDKVIKFNAKFESMWARPDNR